MTSKLDDDITSNLFKLAQNDFNKTIFIGVFKLLIYNENEHERQSGLFWDTKNTCKLEFDLTYPFDMNTFVINDNYLVKFYHACEEKKNLLLIDEIEEFKSNILKTKPDMCFYKKEGEDDKINNKITDQLIKRISINFPEKEKHTLINDINYDIKKITIKGFIEEKSFLKKYLKNNEYFFDIKVMDKSGLIQIFFLKSTSIFYNFLCVGEKYIFKNFELKFKLGIVFLIYDLYDSTIEKVTKEKNTAIKIKRVKKPKEIEECIDIDNFVSIKNIDRIEKLTKIKIEGVLKTKRQGFKVESCRFLYFTENFVLEIEDSSGKIQMDFEKNDTLFNLFEINVNYKFENVVVEELENSKILLFKNQISTFITSNI